MGLKSPRLLVGLLFTAFLAIAVYLLLPSSATRVPERATPRAEEARRAEATAPASSHQFPALGEISGTRLQPNLWRAASTATPGTVVGREAKLSREFTRMITELREGDDLDLPIFDGVHAPGTVTLIQQDTGGWYRVAGTLQGGDRSAFSLSTDGRTVAGLLQYPSRNLALQISGTVSSPILRERLLSDLLCLPMPRPDFETSTPATSGTTSVPTAAIPLLSSRPTATSVIYLDFDGETVTDSSWNGGRTINAKAPTVTSTQIQQIWQRVKEDYWAFNIDITTDLTRYTGAQAGKRMRCIITPTDTASPGAGGVAYVDSFSEAGTGGFSSTIPSWVFNTSVTGISEAISHEVGHTLGLNHDGRSNPSEEYYAGQGSGATGWAPIMGVGYNKSLVQWSKGEYARANNKQDDLAIISGTKNAFGYIADEAGDTIQTAASLAVNGTDISQPGIITTVNDRDVYVFTTGAGPAAITANPAPLSPNLDILLELLDSTGAILLTSNPADTLPATISATLSGGVYYLRIRGTGKGDPLSTGYSAYASIGEYTITGTIPGGTPAPSITSATTVHAEATLAFSYHITATNSPTSYALTGTLPTGLVFDSGTGTIAGTTTQLGTYSLTMQATNGTGSDSKSLSLIVDPLQIPIISSAATARGTIAFPFAYQISASSAPTSYGVTGTLPQGITLDPDTGLLSGTPQESGTFPLTVTASNNAGMGSASLGLTITVLPPPVITSAASVSTHVRQDFLYQITADNTPTSYNLVGTLPTGLTFDSGLGKIFGTPTVDGLFTVTLVATNAYGDDTLDLSINIDPAGTDLTVALDQLDLVWTTSGNTAWQPVTTGAHDGIDAASITALPDGGTATMEAQLEGPASIQFYWQVSSEKNYDCLTFSVDGVEYFRISGDVKWKLQTVPIPTGTHRLSFRYQKDAYNSGGQDFAMVDEVLLIPREIASGSDSFATAQALTGAHISLTSSNVAATTETNEPSPVGRGFGHSLWWSWTAPESGIVSLSTAGSQFDTVLAIYSGTTLGGLTRVASGDDASRSDRTSRVRFRAVAGTTYFITVAGYTSASGQVKLSIDLAAPGSYAGVLTPDAGPDALAASITLRLSANLGYTGAVRFAARSYPFRGTLAAGADSIMVSRGKTQPPLNLTLSTDLTNGDNAVAGTLTDGAASYQFLARRRIAARDISPVVAGPYTVLLESPGLGTTVPYGTGYGRLLASSSGGLRFIGSLGDGQTVSEGSFLTFGYRWSAFLAPYRGSKLGTVSGELTFDPVANLNLSGTLHWRYEEAGVASFSDDLAVTGTYYLTPSTNYPSLVTASGSQNIQLTFDHRDAPANPADPRVTFTPNRFTDIPAGYQLKLSAATGLFTGYLPEPGSGTRRAFGGVLLQSRTENRGAGRFQSTTGSGRITLRPTP